MDDIVVLAPSRWKLKRAVRVVNQMLNGLGLEKHPEKTFIGRIERGFDFFGASPSSRQACETHQRFLQTLQKMLPPDCRPIVVRPASI